MKDQALALDLLSNDVPLTLLFDLAGFGPTSEELYRREGSVVTQMAADRPLLTAVAS